MNIRELATGVASCVMLLPAGCKKTPATVTVVPEGGEPSANAADSAECDAPESASVKQVAAGSSGDRQAPAVLGARFTSRDRLQLTFSEPIAPPSQVNPRQFRLSMAYSMVEYGYGEGYGYGGEQGYASGYYYDLAGNDNYEPPLVVTALELYEGQPELLGLRLSRPVPVQLCEDIRDSREEMAEDAAEGPGNTGRVGLFLHYTSRGSVGIRDLADNPMADMGAEWALHFGARNKSMYGTEPIMRLDLLVELECPNGMGAGGPPGPS